MSDTSPQDPRDELCHVVPDGEEPLPALTSRDNAERYAEILTASHPEGISHTVECVPVSVVDALESAPRATETPASFAPGESSRGA